MHELSIALGIIDLVEAEARKNGSSRVEEVELEIGTLAGVEIRTLEFALDSAVKGTLLQDARIIRIYIEGSGYCNDCRVSFPVSTLFSPCPDCGSYCVKIVKGKELRVKSIVIS